MTELLPLKVDSFTLRAQMYFINPQINHQTSKSHLDTVIRMQVNDIYLYLRYFLNGRHLRPVRSIVSLISLSRGQLVKCFTT